MGMEMMPSPETHASRRSSRMGANFIDYGQINFTMHNTTQNAEFVLAQHDTDKKNIVTHMMEAWEISQPGLLLRVTGAERITHAGGGGDGEPAVDQPAGCPRIPQ